MVGENKIKVTVDTDDEDNSQDYTIEVTRERPPVELKVSYDLNGDGAFEAYSTTTDAEFTSDVLEYSGNRAQIQVSRPAAGIPGVDALSGLEIMTSTASGYMDLPWDTTSTDTEKNTATTDILMLAEGANQFKVRVGGKTGAVYTINITRAAPVSVLTVIIDSDGDGRLGGPGDRAVSTTSATYLDTLVYSERRALIEVEVNRPQAPDAPGGVDDLIFDLNNVRFSWGPVLTPDHFLYGVVFPHRFAGVSRSMDVGREPVRGACGRPRRAHGYADSRGGTDA